MTIAATWADILKQLQLQMSAATFDTWLRGTTARIEGDDWIIHAHSPQAVEWLDNRLRPVVERIIRHRNPNAAIRFTADHRPDPSPDPKPDAEPAKPKSRPRPTATYLHTFNPNTAETGGFTQLGNYAAAYWAAYLGTTAWRIYEIIYGAHRRRKKTAWTPPRSWTISGLARAVPASRNAIRGRWRRLDDGTRLWRPGAFDVLVREQVARIHWHDNNPHWRTWIPGGFERSDASGQRIIYRLSVLIILPLLTPHQIAQLPAALIRDHEHYLAGQDDIDILGWEQITRRSLAPQLDAAIITGAGGALTGAPAPVADSFFSDPSGTSETA